ncbi:RNA polymerase sigma factor ['Paenibacillus yunnanensis' Narsing Rao et al. 2020]|uniref:RNA polymerase sigma factor n=1 Tax=Paenibacillus tengchongensis TaxID=2608684 RepID=UPI00124E5F1A|nr:sigma-70 family RNA polymerase sigma factor [Paenibacillus tengchongensis]
MDKQHADRVIKAYMKPLYGFALNKTGNIAEAEELAGRITLEVYRTLLKKSEVFDLNSYVFKIAHYVWAKYAGERVKAANHLRIEDYELMSRDEGFDEIIRQETASALRREIAFLSHQQREIVVKYYYDGLGTAIRQNIAYAAYHKLLTVQEMAEELGVPPVFIGDEIAILEKYGFLEPLPGGKYRTNMYIEDPSQGKIEALHRLFAEYAEIAAEQYFRPFFAQEEVFRETGVYIPGGDFNMLLWSLIPYAGNRLNFKELGKVSHSEVAVSRIDGGYYAAHATIDRPLNVSFNRAEYYFCGDMYRDSDEFMLKAWQADTRWCGRQYGWRDNWSSDFIYLMQVINGSLPQNDANIDIYRRLFDKQYLLRTGSGLEVNIVYCKDKQTGERLQANIPQPSERVKAAAMKLDQEVYRLNLEGQPEHARKYVRYWSQNSMASGAMRAYILKYLVDTNMLKVPDPHRQKGASTLMFMNQS